MDQAAKTVPREKAPFEASSSVPDFGNSITVRIRSRRDRPPRIRLRHLVLFVLLSAAIALPVGYNVTASYQAARREAASEARTGPGVDRLQAWRVDTGLLIAFALLAELLTGIAFLELVRSDVRRHRTEGELREIHERLSTFIEALPEVVILKDGESRWRTINGPRSVRRAYYTARDCPGH